MGLSIRQNDYWRSSPLIHKPWFSNLSGLDITVKTCKNPEDQRTSCHHPIIPSCKPVASTRCFGLNVTSDPSRETFTCRGWGVNVGGLMFDMTFKYVCILYYIYIHSSNKIFVRITWVSKHYTYVCFSLSLSLSLSLSVSLSLCVSLSLSPSLHRHQVSMPQLSTLI